jgi:hypothetical protein
MVIEPPRNPGRGRILEVHDGILVAGKLALIEERAGAVHQAVILIACPGGNSLTVKSREQRG